MWHIKYRMKPVSATSTYSHIHRKMRWLKDEVRQKVKEELQLQLHVAMTTNEGNQNELNLSEDGLPGERSLH